MTGGDIDAGTSRNRLDRAYRLPQLDAGPGTEVVKYMKEIRRTEPEIDFDTVDYEEEND